MTLVDHNESFYSASKLDYLFKYAEYLSVSSSNLSIKVETEKKIMLKSFLLLMLDYIWFGLLELPLIEKFVVSLLKALEEV